MSPGGLGGRGGGGGGALGAADWASAGGAPEDVAPPPASICHRGLAYPASSTVICALLTPVSCQSHTGEFTCKHVM